MNTTPREALSLRLKRLVVDVERVIGYLENDLPIIPMTEEEHRLGVALYGPSTMVIGNWTITEIKR